VVVVIALAMSAQACSRPASTGGLTTPVGGPQTDEMPAVPRLVPLEVGVQFRGMWEEYEDPERLAVLDKLAAARVAWVRLDLAWAGFEPEAPGVVSDWYKGRAEWLVNEARARGLKVLGMLWWAPSWAQTEGTARNEPPADPQQYARFAGWMAATFAGRVSAWEIWTAPNRVATWTGTPAQYAALVRAAYPAIKAAAPSAVVVAGSVAQNDDGWLAQAYRAGIGGSFDALATQPYMAPSDAPPQLPDDGTVWRIDHVRAVHDLMVAQGDGDKAIWFTEFGWSSHGGSDDRNWKFGVTEDVQAKYLTTTLTQVRNTYPYVTNVFWYNERDRETGDPQQDNRGLLRRDLSEKPAYKSLQAALS
jgi:hypothetical protein